MMKAHVLSGIDQLPRYIHLLKGRKCSLMTNPTGMDHHFNSTIDLLSKECRLTSLFACEHGIRGAQAAGENISSDVDERTGIPVFSTYGDSRHLSSEMLDTFDVFVFDMQDVGARFYTYLYSLSYAMEACARKGKSVVVMDRINPLGGISVEGTVLDERFHSFVGEYALPTRYGLTIGEYALWVKDHLKLDLDLTVVPLKGWYRDYLLPDMDIPWVSPSPNCPNFESVLCYIGTCIFEGTNISEGRGTALPFQLIGAPFIDAYELSRRMNNHHFEGVHFRPCAFTPTASKHMGKLCQGVQLHVSDPCTFPSFLAGLTLMDEIRNLHPDQFEFLSGTVLGIPSHLDHLLGTDEYRLGHVSAKELCHAHQEKLSDFKKEREQFFLYHQ